MATFKPKQDETSISFHYLIRQKTDEEKKDYTVKFTDEEFDDVHAYLKSLKKIDFDDESVNLKIRSRMLVEIKKVEDFDGRYISGIYKAAYWGHSYDNTVKGKIPADSINLKPFFFLLYLSKSGKIYIASQYLGYFGGYGALKSTILSALKNRHEISSNSFNFGSISYEKIVPKKVEIKFSRQNKSITGANLFGKSGAIVLKKQSKDDNFEGNVSKEILDHLHKSDKDIKKVLAKLLKSKDLIDMNDEDIDDCKVLAKVDGKTKTIHIFDDNGFATKFPANVGLDSDGHPHYEPLKKKAIEILKKEIIAKKENV